MARRRYPSLGRTFLSDFSGGWNPHDAPLLLAENESPDCLNITLDEQGGIVKRLGMQKYNGTQVGTVRFDQIFYSDSLRQMIAQQGANLYYTAGGGAWTIMPGMPLPSAGRVGMCDALGKVYIVIPDSGVSGGVRVWDGVTLGAKILNSPSGSMIVPWQNYLITAGEPTWPNRFSRSKLVDATGFAWDPTGTGVGTTFNELHEEDDTPITAMCVAQRVDDVGKPGLLLFKKRGIFRAYETDPTKFGAYRTLSSDAGAAGPMCVTTMRNLIASVNEDGVWITDGLTVPELVQPKLEPFFRSDQVNYSELHRACINSHQDRFIVSLAQAGEDYNSLTLEIDPNHKWVVPHGFGVSCMAIWRKDADVLYGGAARNGFAYRLFVGGSDDGADITAYWTSRPYVLNLNGEVRLRRLRVTGRGAFGLAVIRDLELSSGQLSQVDLRALAGMHWGEMVWNQDIWGPGAYEDTQDFWMFLLAREYQFRLTETSSLSALGPRMVPDGASPEIGAFALYGLRLDYMPLGMA